MSGPLATHDFSEGGLEAALQFFRRTRNELRAVQSDPDAPMFESIRVGIQAALETSAEATVLLQPGEA